MIYLCCQTSQGNTEHVARYYRYIENCCQHNSRIMVPQCYIMLYSFMLSFLPSLFLHLRPLGTWFGKTTKSDPQYIPSSSRCLEWSPVRLTGRVLVWPENFVVRAFFWPARYNNGKVILEYKTNQVIMRQNDSLNQYPAFWSVNIPKYSHLLTKLFWSHSVWIQNKNVKWWAARSNVQKNRFKLISRILAGNMLIE